MTEDKIELETDITEMNPRFALTDRRCPECKSPLWTMTIGRFTVTYCENYACKYTE